MIPADRIQMGEDEHYTQCSLENQVPRKEVDSKELMEVRSCVVHLGRKGWKSLGYRTEKLFHLKSHFS